MDLPIFRESIERSHKILESKGLDLIKIITDDDPNVFENILNSFVGIAAVQVNQEIFIYCKCTIECLILLLHVIQCILSVSLKMGELLFSDCSY